MTLIDRIKKHEGFVGTQYNDSLGKPTIGYGTLLPLTEVEAELLLRHRLEAKEREIMRLQPIYARLPYEKQEIILEMCYQLGVQGVIRFRRMWAALEVEDYETASVEMLDSTWNKQTPNRAKNLAGLMRA